MKNNNIISVILPSLNVSAYIRICLDSVTNQSYDDLDIICVDAGSTDGTLDIIEEYAHKDNRIHIIHSDKKSYGYQVNLGIRSAYGDYIGIVDTDDWIDRECYEKLSQYIYDDLDFIKCNFIGVKGDAERAIRKQVKTLYGGYEYNHTLNQQDMYLLQLGDYYDWNGIYKKDFLLKNHISFNETDGAAMQDTGFRYRIFGFAENGIYIDEPLYYYRMQREGASVTSPKSFGYAFYEYSDVVEHAKSWLNYSKGFNSILWLCFLNSMLCWSGNILSSINYNIDSDFFTTPYQKFMRLVMRHKEDVEKAMLELPQQTQVICELFFDSPHSYIDYRRAEHKIRNREKSSLLIGDGDLPAVIVGDGRRGHSLYDRFFEYGMPVCAAADNDVRKHSEATNYFPEVISLDEAVRKYKEKAVFYIANKNYEAELRQQLISLGVKKDSIVTYRP